MFARGSYVLLAVVGMMATATGALAQTWEEAAKGCIEDMVELKQAADASMARTVSSVTQQLEDLAADGATEEELIEVAEKGIVTLNGRASDTRKKLQRLARACDREIRELGGPNWVRQVVKKRLNVTRKNVNGAKQRSKDEIMAVLDRLLDE